MVYNWRINKDLVSRSFILNSLFLCIAGLLIYVDYLQEVYLFTTTIDLQGVQVDADSYNLLETLNHLNNLTDSNLGFQSIKYNSDSMDSDLDFRYRYFPMEPPFPKLDLGYLQPVFQEGGKLYLNCKTSFMDFKCRLTGFIGGQKVYLADTIFNESIFETIEFKYINSDRWDFSPSRFITSNQGQLNVITNYLYLFGYNGTYYPQVEDRAYSSSFTSKLKLDHYVGLRSNLIRILKLEYMKCLLLEIMVISIGSITITCLGTRLVFILIFKRHQLLNWNPSMFFSLRSKTARALMKEDEDDSDDYDGGLAGEHRDLEGKQREVPISDNGSISIPVKSKNPPPRARFESYFHYFDQWPASTSPVSISNELDDLMVSKITNNNNIKNKRTNSTSASTDNFLIPSDEIGSETRYRYKRNPWFERLKIVYCTIITIVLVYHISFYITNFCIQSKITDLLERTLGTSFGNFKGIQNPKEEARLTTLNKQQHGSAGESTNVFNCILAVAGIVLNTLIFGTLHCLHGIAMYMYTFS